jgi:transposase
MANLGPTTMGMEACGGAHSWARRLREQGHTVKLMAPQFVKPDVKSNNNDRRDAEAIAEAGTRPSMRFVPVQDIAQQDIQALHRVRERLVTARTALIKEIRGLLAEYGVGFPQGVAQLRQTLVRTLEAEQAQRTPLSQALFPKLCEECGRLDKEVAYYQEQLEAWAHTHPVCQRLPTMPGIGPLTANNEASLKKPSRKSKSQFCKVGEFPRQ